ncbi:MAG TPA: ribosome maturation factor RimM [Bacillota bacterium]
MTEKMFEIGKIINTHGIRGEVKVFRITHFEERFSVGNTVYVVKEEDKPLQLTIDGHRVHKGYDLLHFEGYNRIEDVETFKNAYLKITEEQLTELEEGSYYYYEIIGCSVYTNKGKKVGDVKEILSPGANDVWVVIDDVGNETLIPFITDVVTDVDVKSKKIIIHPMEGLLD